MQRLTFTLIALLLALPVAAQTTMPTPVFVGTDSNNLPISGGKLCTYAAGTSTPANTYTSYTLSVANDNPLVLDAAGRGNVFLTSGQSYKFVLRQPGSAHECTTGAIVWTQDYVQAIPTSAANLDILGTAGAAITAGNCVYLSDGSGGKTAGQWFVCDSTNTYSSTTPTIGMAPSAISSGVAGTIRLSGSVTGLSALVVGSTYYVSTAGTLTATIPANGRLVGVADTTASIVLAANPAPLRQKVDTYTATLANVSNTVTKTTILSFTIPANAMSDGDWIEIQMTNLEKNNKGSDGAVAVEVTVGAGAAVPVVAATVATNSATEYTDQRPLKLQRVGTGVQVYGGGDAGRADWGITQDSLIVRSAGVSTPTNFTSANVVNLKVTLSAADATFYIKPQAAVVVHFKN